MALKFLVLAETSSKHDESVRTKKATLRKKVSLSLCDIKEKRALMLGHQWSKNNFSVSMMTPVLHHPMGGLEADA